MDWKMIILYFKGKNTMFAFSLGLILSAMISLDWPDFSSVSHVAPTGNDDVALIIAIEDYAYTTDVDGAVQNALAWEKFLRKELQVSKIVTILNENATKEEIIYKTKGLSSHTTENSRIWLIYIGHGAPSAQGKHGMLVGVDAQQTARGLESRSVPIPQIIDILEKTPSKDQIAIIDACFSGLSSEGSSLAPGLQPLIATKDLQPSKVHVLTAAQGNQFAGPLPGSNRPAFSYLMLGALRGWADIDRNKQVTLNEALHYSQQVLLETVSGRSQSPQHLVGNDNNENIILTKQGDEKPPDHSSILNQKRIDAEIKKEFREKKELQEEKTPLEKHSTTSNARYKSTTRKKNKASFRIFKSRRTPPNIQMTQYKTAISKDQIEFFTDKQGNFIARFLGKEEELFTGTLENMHVQVYQGSFKSGGERFSYTLIDPRFVSSNQRHFELKDSRYQLTCGEQKIEYFPYQVSEEDFQNVQWYERPWKRISFLLARDEFGVYYFVDQARSRRPNGNTDLRLYIGTKGDMSYQPLDDVIFDAAGIILRSQENRFVVKNEPKKTIYWANSSNKTELMEVNLYQSQQMIYNELGVYPKKNYSTMCDPHMK
jgi:uncharacterized caspase-like protein